MGFAPAIKIRIAPTIKADSMAIMGKNIGNRDLMRFINFGFWIIYYELRLMGKV